MSWIQSDLQYTPPEPYVPCEWSSGTDAEIVEAVEMHYAGRCDLREYWSVGDERTIHLSEMSTNGMNDASYISAQDIKLVLLNAGGKYLEDGTTECAFVVGQKNLFIYTGSSPFALKFGDRTALWKDNITMRTWCNSIYYNAFPSTIKQIFKSHINKTGAPYNYSDTYITTTDYFELPSEKELFGVTSDLPYPLQESDLPHFTYYQTSSNRIKYYGNSSGASEYWGRSVFGSYSSLKALMVTNTGNRSYSDISSYNWAYGITPQGVI